MSAPAVAVSDKHNKLVIAWKDVRAGEPNVYWSVSEGRGFELGSRVHAGLRGRQDHPSVAIDSRGLAWIAWEDSGASGNEVKVRSEDENSEVVVSSGVTASFPVIACGGESIAVAYEAQIEGRRTIYFRKLHR